MAKVTNQMMEATTSIHWHGQHQKLSPYMDGVPSVTQCPIQPGASFTYSFVATQAGTHFYHSHSGKFLNITGIFKIYFGLTYGKYIIICNFDFML